MSLGCVNTGGLKAKKPVSRSGIFFGAGIILPSLLSPTCNAVKSSPAVPACPLVFRLQKKVQRSNPPNKQRPCRTRPSLKKRTTKVLGFSLVSRCSVHAVQQQLPKSFRSSRYDRPPHQLKLFLQDPGPLLSPARS